MPIQGVYVKCAVMRRFLPLIVFIAGFMAWQGMHKEPVDAAPAPPGNALAPLFDAAAQSSSASFSCDGRQYCSQMTSCAEATYFLRHCPDSRMDGDHDGVPCESQWCGTR